MNGRHPIVLMLRNHQFFEHEDEVRATLEAQRLSRVHLAECVVYVPVTTVHPPVPQHVEHLPRDGGQPSAEMAVTDGAEPTPRRERLLTRDEAFDVVLRALRGIPFSAVRVEQLQEDAIALHVESNTPTLFDPTLFHRVLRDMHRVGLITLSEGLVSLVGQP